MMTPVHAQHVKYGEYMFHREYIFHIIPTVQCTHSMLCMGQEHKFLL